MSNSELLLLLAFIVFLNGAMGLKLMKKGPDAPADPTEITLLTEIREELRTRSEPDDQWREALALPSPPS